MSTPVQPTQGFWRSAPRKMFLSSSSPIKVWVFFPVCGAALHMLFCKITVMHCEWHSQRAHPVSGETVGTAMDFDPSFSVLRTSTARCDSVQATMRSQLMALPLLWQRLRWHRNQLLMVSSQVFVARPCRRKLRARLIAGAKEPGDDIRISRLAVRNA